MYNGILVIRKEQGFTSHDVVAKLRGICGQRKIGHTGTLDPNATGVLPMCLGSATKLCDMLTEDRKEYIAELTLGKTTDTQDIWGQVLTDIRDGWKALREEEIREVVASFQGKQLQMPPMYSARKVGGKRLYELARAGIEVERQAREITIDEIEILPQEDRDDSEGTDGTVSAQKDKDVFGKPFHETAERQEPKGKDVFSRLPKLRIRVACSKGTYIRTLCHDIGEKLGCGAVMSSLVRTRVGRFTLEDAYTLTEVEQLRDEQKLSDVLIPIEDCFREYPAVTVLKKGIKLLENGNELPFFMLRGIVMDSFSVWEEKAENIKLDKLPDGQPLRVYNKEGVFYGIYHLQKEKGCIKPWKMFLPEKE